MRAVMKPSMKDSLSAEPSFLLATKDKGPIVPVWVKGYSSFLGHKGKTVHGYGWWQGGELGTTLSSGRGCRNSVCSLCHWSMESGNVDQSVRRKTEGSARRLSMQRVPACVRIDQSEYHSPPGRSDANENHTASPFPPLKSHQHRCRT